MKCPIHKIELKKGESCYLCQSDAMAEQAKRYYEKTNRPYPTTPKKKGKGTK